MEDEFAGGKTVGRETSQKKAIATVQFKVDKGLNKAVVRMEEETEDQIYKEQQERQEAKQETLLLWKVMENCIS